MFAQQLFASFGPVRFREEVEWEVLDLSSEAVAVARLASRRARNSLWS